MDETYKKIYGSEYLITVHGTIFTRTKTGKPRLMNPSTVVNKNKNDYLAVKLELEKDGKKSKKTIPVKKIVADHFKIRVMDGNTLLPEPELIDNAHVDNLDHIDGDIKNCAAENICFYNKFDPNRCCPRLSRSLIYRKIEDYSDVNESDILIDDIPGYYATSNGKIISTLMGKETALTPFKNNESDKHLSVMMSFEDKNYNRKRKTFVVSQLIAKAFRPYFKNQLESGQVKITYRDGDPSNCSIHNLVLLEKLSDPEIRKIRKEIEGKSEDYVQEYMMANGLLENI